MAVVMAAKRVSPMPSPLGLVDGLAGGCRRLDLDGELLAESAVLFGRHLRTASTEALHGWTWRG